MAALSYSELLEAVNKGFEYVIEKAFNDIDEIFERCQTVKIPVSVILTATGPGGQVDVITTINLVTNEDQKPERFVPDRIKQEKRIRLNPAQRQLPGQGE